MPLAISATSQQFRPHGPVRSWDEALRITSYAVSGLGWSYHQVTKSIGVPSVCKGAWYLLCRDSSRGFQRDMCRHPLALNHQPVFVCF